MPDAVPGQDRLRRRHDEHAQPAAQDGQEEVQPGARRRACSFSNATNPNTINLTRKVMIDWGYKAQRLGNGRVQEVRAQADFGAAGDRRQAAGRRAGDPLRQQEMPGNLPKKTARALLDIEDDKIVPIIRNPAGTSVDSEAVFYFPGCGSESPVLAGRPRDAGDALARRRADRCCRRAIWCCGYPQRGAGQYDKAEKTVTDNRVLFHRVANTLNYLDIKTVRGLVRDVLRPARGLRIRQDLPGLPDHRHPRVSCWRNRSGSKVRPGVRYMYHDPCHTPIKTMGPDETRQPVDDLGRERRLYDREERSLLRRVGHARGHAARCLDAGAFSQGRGNAQGHGQGPRGRLRGRGQDPDELPVVSPGPVALSRRCRRRGGLHRRGDRAQPARRELDGRLRREANSGGIERVLV